MHMPYAYTYASCIETYLCACTYIHMHISNHTPLSLSAAPVWKVLPSLPTWFYPALSVQVELAEEVPCVTRSTEDEAG